jgi:Sulfatase
MVLPRYRWRLAHLAALWAYGVSQPVFSMLKANPEFLVVRGSSRTDVIAFALILVFVPPLAVVAVEALAGLASATLANALHVVAVWCFSFVVALQLMRLWSPAAGATLLLPLVPAALAAVAYVRWRPFRSFLSVSVVLPVVGTVAFVASVPLVTDDRPGADIAVTTRTPVVLLVMDEFTSSSLLRADGSIDAVRYPNFARLAQTGTWYPRATTVHEFTTQAVPAILTGRLPRDGELPTLKDHPENLFTLLGERYAFNVIEPVTRLCPSRYCRESHVSPPLLDRYRGLLYDVGVAYLYRVLPRSLRAELPPIGDRWGGFGQDDAGTRDRLLGALDANDVNLAIDSTDHQPRAEFERFLRLIRPGAPGRSLYFLHFMLPHAPWQLLPSGHEYGNAATIDGIHDDAFNDWGRSRLAVDQALQRHLLQVGYTDRLIGLLVQRLKRAGIYDRAVVIATADHGVSFAAGGSRRFVTNANVADIASVPLFVKYPGQRRGRVDLRHAETIDILPTIADVIGVRMPWHVDGRSLRGRSGVRAASVAKRDGSAVVTSSARVEAGVLAAARRNAALFGEGHDSMYRLGPHAELLGRLVATLPPSPARNTQVRLDGETLFADVEPSSGFVPARVVGDIEGRSPPDGTPVAIAVNGRIEAMTRSFPLDGRSRFAALVPESAFREGSNAVDVYAVDPAGTGVRLALLGGTAHASEYALSHAGTSIALPSGKRAEVEAGRLAGRVESSVVEGGTVRIRGWAADLRDDALVDRVLIFSGRRLLFASTTSVYRWDVGETSNRRGLQRAGWVAEIPRADLRAGDVRAFAVRGTVASQLEWPDAGRGLVVAAGAPRVPATGG